MKRLLPAALAAVLLWAGCALPGIRWGRIAPPAGSRARTVMMETTGYCPCGECCGWKRTWYGRPVYASGPLRGKPKAVGITASGARARPGTLAADTARYPFGTVMRIPGYGYGVVEDRGGAITGNRIDLFFRTHSKAQAWGRKRLAVTVWDPPR